MGKRILKIIASGGLAVLMGAGVLCGMLIAPMNSTHANTSAGALTPQEQLLAGTLNLDPENDPVVFTTDYGLEIKSHNEAGLVDVTTNDPSSNGTVTVSSTSWNYISAGGYNWIIIGQYASSSYTLSTIRGDEYSGNNPDATDAGNAIEDANGNGLLKTNVTIPAFTNAIAPSNGEIPAGCVLCLCAGTTGTSYFDNTSPHYSYFPSSDLDTAMTNVYNSIKSSLKILPTSLTTYGYDMDTGTITTYTHIEYLFPLATNEENSSQNFCVQTYLNSTTKRDISNRWWLRSGYSSSSSGTYDVGWGGSINRNYAYGVYVVRPAFVLQLYSA